MLNFIIFFNFTFEIGATEHYKFPYFGSASAPRIKNPSLLLLRAPDPLQSLN